MVAIINHSVLHDGGTEGEGQDQDTRRAPAVSSLTALKAVSLESEE